MDRDLGFEVSQEMIELHVKEHYFPNCNLIQSKKLTSGWVNLTYLIELDVENEKQNDFFLKNSKQITVILRICIQKDSKFEEQLERVMFLDYLRQCTSCHVSDYIARVIPSIEGHLLVRFLNKYFSQIQQFIPGSHFLSYDRKVQHLTSISKFMGALHKETANISDSFYKINHELDQSSIEGIHREKWKKKSLYHIRSRAIFLLKQLLSLEKPDIREMAIKHWKLLDLTIPPSNQMMLDDANEMKTTTSSSSVISSSSSSSSSTSPKLNDILKLHKLSQGNAVLDEKNQQIIDDSLPKSVVHGDIHSTNVKFFTGDDGKDRLAAVLDWDDYFISHPCIYDLCFVLISWCIPLEHSNALEIQNGDLFNYTYANIVVKEYESSRGYDITSLEAEHLVMYMLAACFFELCFVYELLLTERDTKFIGNYPELLYRFLVDVSSNMTPQSFFQSIRSSKRITL